MENLGELCNVTVFYDKPLPSGGVALSASLYGFLDDASGDILLRCESAVLASDNASDLISGSSKEHTAARGAAATLCLDIAEMFEVGDPRSVHISGVIGKPVEEAVRGTPSFKGLVTWVEALVTHAVFVRTGRLIRRGSRRNRGTKAAWSAAGKRA